MAQWLRSSPCMPGIPCGRRFCPSSPTSLPAPCLWPRTAQSSGTLHPRGRPGRSSWLRIGIALAVAASWGVNHWTEDLPLYLSSLYIHLSNKKNNKNKSLKKNKVKERVGCIHGGWGHWRGYVVCLQSNGTTSSQQRGDSYANIWANCTKSGCAPGVWW